MRLWLQLFITVQNSVMAKKDLMSDPVIKYAALGVGLIVVGKMFGTLDALLEALGLKDDQDKKDLDQAATDANSFWSPLFHRNAPVGTVILTNAAAQQDADDIYNGTGFFDDNEDQIIAVFHRLRTQAQVSFLADVFNQKYHADLLTWLRGGIWPQDRLSDADVNGLNTYIKSLPKYK